MTIKLPPPGTFGQAMFDRIWHKAIVCEPRGKRKPRVKIEIAGGYLMINQEWVEDWRAETASEGSK